AALISLLRAADDGKGQNCVHCEIARAVADDRACRSPRCRRRSGANRSTSLSDDGALPAVMIALL
ncbi:hypothetical protein ABTP66_19610, partial [Acinetobacter baumannii]